MKVHQSGAGWVWAVVCILTLATASCQTPPALDRLPPDFSLVFNVAVPDGVESGDPALRPTQYVIEPDRTLRAALGAGATFEFYPRPTATLSPRQMEQVWSLIREHGLLEAASQQAGDDPHTAPTVHCRLAITAHGRRHHLAASPETVPGLHALARFLAHLRGAG